MLWNVPLIHIEPLSFNMFLHNLIHFLLYLIFSSILKVLSHSPLFTIVCLPEWHEIPLLDKKYGGSAKIKSTDFEGNFFSVEKQSELYKVKLVSLKIILFFIIRN